jgi:hypothetical protein
MITVRLTVILFTFGLSISNASAQLVHSSIVTQQHASKPVPSEDDHMLSSLPFTVALSGSNQVQVGSDSTYTFYCQVTNLSKNADTLYFKRSQQLPIGWNTSVCLNPGECYADRTDSVVFVLSPNATLNGNIILSLNVDPSLNNVSDSTVVWLRVGLVGSLADTIMLPFYISFVPLNPALVFQWDGIAGSGPSFDTTFVGTGHHAIDNFLENDFGLGADYNFTIQDSLPAGWSLTTCIQNSYSDTCTEGNNLTVNFSDYTDSTYQQAIKFTLNVPELTATDSAILYLGVHPKISSPADSATYRFSMIVMPLSGVATQPAEQAGMVITSTWPDPLHPASMLHIGVQTGQQGTVTTGIYDLDGVLNGTLEFGQLHAGSNDLQARMPDLPSGEYILRIQQGNETPEIARISYIK